MRTPLHDSWTLRPVAGDVPAPVATALRGGIPATVPGCVHTDLLAAGLIADPYLDDQEGLQSWIGLADWRYERTFAWDPDSGERADLVFEGLDTVATVEVNGTVVTRTANMHRTHRVDVRDALRPGDNALAVTFASAVRAADRASLELGARPHVNHHPYNAIRKMACNFGWDWGPDLVTAGMWRPVALEAWSTARIAAVRPLATVDGRCGTVEVHVDVERAGPSATDAALALDVRVGSVRVAGEVAGGATSAVVRVELEDVDLWWPRGHGDQPLYDVEVQLLPAATADGGGPLDRWTSRIGFRTVRLDTSADEWGSAATLVVNDRPVFVRGANWIPDDAFPHRVGRERVEARVAQAEEAGVNLLRVWGGGVFESNDFYEVCDERGVMTWQDFLFACAAYAEEEPMRSEVEAEARDNVTRLLPHASLVMWSGCNENLWGHEDWGWIERLDGRTWGAGYYDDLLPGIVAELDPHRPYTPGSPFSPQAPDGTREHPNDPDHGTMHIWDVWNQRDYTTYRSHVPRFAAEFGWQGPPTWSTMRRAISDDPLTPESPGMLVHQKADQGNDKLTTGLVPHFRVPDDVEDWHWAMSLNQARAVALGVEHFRSWSPRCAGSIVWQLNDCWPVTSWAAVDGDGRRKPLLYALRHAHADRLLTVQPREGGLAVVAVNDVDDPWTGRLEVTRRTYAGEVLDRAVVDLHAASRGAVTLALPGQLATAGDAACELLVAEASGVRALWFFAEDRDSALAPPALDARVEAVPTGYRVHLRARALVRDVALLADKVDPDAVVDDMLLTLLPGQSAVVQVRTTRQLQEAELLSPTVLRSANQLVTTQHVQEGQR